MDINKVINKKMLGYEITKAAKQILQVDNSSFMAVDFNIINVESKEVIAIRSLSFDLGSTTEAIKAELQKYVEAFQAELDMFAANKEQEKVEKQADETISELLAK